MKKYIKKHLDEGKYKHANSEIMRDKHLKKFLDYLCFQIESQLEKGNRE